MEVTTKSLKSPWFYFSRIFVSVDKWRAKGLSPCRSEILVWAVTCFRRHNRGATGCRATQPLRSSSMSQQTPLSCATHSCLGDPASVCVPVQHMYAFCTVSLSVTSAWVTPVTVHMFAGCRCAEGYLHTHCSLRWCCEWRELPHPFPFLITCRSSSFWISGVSSLSHLF